MDLGSIILELSCGDEKDPFVVEQDVSENINNNKRFFMNVYSAIFDKCSRVFQNFKT